MWHHCCKMKLLVYGTRRDIIFGVVVAYCWQGVRIDSACMKARVNLLLNIEQNTSVIRLTMWPKWQKRVATQYRLKSIKATVIIMVPIWSNSRGPMTFDPFPKVQVIMEYTIIYSLFWYSKVTYIISRNICWSSRVCFITSIMK